MTPEARIEILEASLVKVWGAMWLADSVVSDPKVKAAFVKVDSELRKSGLGLQPRAGMQFIEPTKTSP